MKKIEQSLRLLVFLAVLFLVMVATPPVPNREPPANASFLFMPPTCGDGVVGDCLPPSNLEEFEPEEYFPIISGKVYFEYPSGWEMYHKSPEEIIFTPSKDSPEGAGLEVISLYVMTDSAVIEHMTGSDISTSPCFERTNLEWYSTVYLRGFQGFHCYWNYKDQEIPILEYVLINVEDQVFVGIVTKPLDNRIARKINDSRTANQMFPNIARIVESLRILER